MIETIQQRRLGGRKDSVVASVNAQRTKPAFDFSYDKNPFRSWVFPILLQQYDFVALLEGCSCNHPALMSIWNVWGRDKCGSDHDVYHQRPLSENGQGHFISDERVNSPTRWTIDFFCDYSSIFIFDRKIIFHLNSNTRTRDEICGQAFGIFLFVSPRIKLQTPFITEAKERRRFNTFPIFCLRIRKSMKVDFR